jgi:hypothetical protein
MTDTAFNDLFASADPEQRLRIVQSEMLTPIEIIRGYAALIKIKITDLNTQELIECIDKIEEAAERLKMLQNAIR